MENKVPLLKKADFYVSIVMFLFGALILYQMMITTVSESRYMPGIVLIIVMFAGVTTLIQTIKNKKNPVEVGALRISKKELLVIVVLFISYYLITILGFYASLFVMTIGLSLVLWGCKKPKDYLILLVYNVLLVVLLYVMFHNIFAMVMPMGIFV